MREKDEEGVGEEKGSIFGQIRDERREMAGAGGGREVICVTSFYKKFL